MKRIVLAAAAWMATCSTGWAKDELIDLPLTCQYDGQVVLIRNPHPNYVVYVGTHIYVAYITRNKYNLTRSNTLDFNTEQSMVQGYGISHAAPRPPDSDKWDPDCAASAIQIPKLPPPVKPVEGGGKAPGSGPAMRPK